MRDSHRLDTYIEHDWPVPSGLGDSFLDSRSTSESFPCDCIFRTADWGRDVAAVEWQRDPAAHLQIALLCLSFHLTCNHLRAA